MSQIVGASFGLGVVLWGLISCAGLLAMLALLQRTFASAPCLEPAPARAPTGAGSEPEPGAGLSPDSLTVVVPAYNEAANIADCVASILASDPPCSAWRLLVVDDGSSDQTAALAEAAFAARSVASALLPAGPRPQGERWVGKNWACDQANRWLDQAGGSDWVLFLDADVRLEPAALRLALADASRHGTDLLSLAPRLRCSCLAEWLVQPIIASLLGLGFPIQRANDPADPLAFAAGPFMLFRRSSYLAVGGHGAVAAEVVEDLALARAIKGRGLRLRYLLALDQVTLQMYPTFQALWEGWSKNWFLGLDRDVFKALGAGALVVQLFAVPWLLLPFALLLAGQQLLSPLLATPFLSWAPLAVALTGIGLQLAIRLWSRRRFGLPLDWWWLAWLGALVIGAIAPVSVLKTLTGRGWTWRGRSLQA